jgi:hypothetical protein
VVIQMITKMMKQMITKMMIILSSDHEKVRG